MAPTATQPATSALDPHLYQVHNVTTAFAFTAFTIQLWLTSAEGELADAPPFRAKRQVLTLYLAGTLVTMATYAIYRVATGRREILYRILSPAWELLAVTCYLLGLNCFAAMFEASVKATRSRSAGYRAVADEVGEGARARGAGRAR